MEPETKPEPSPLAAEVVKALKTCYDPEIPVNIYEMGLVYGVDITPANEVTVRMTLTSPSCPAAQSLPSEVQAKAGLVPGVASAKVELVWEPQWNPNMMSEAAKLQLGLM